MHGAPALPDSARKQCPKATMRMGSWSSGMIWSRSMPASGTSAVPVRHMSVPSTEYTCIPAAVSADSESANA